MGSLIVDLENLYRQTFGSKPYKVSSGDSVKVPVSAPYLLDPKIVEQTSSLTGSVLSESFLGTDIWLPIKLRGLNEALRNSSITTDNPFVNVTGDYVYFPYCTVRIIGRKNIVKTPLSQRRGTVKELYNIDDYQITIRGFLIDVVNRTWPEKYLKALHELFEAGQTFHLDNALTNIFLLSSDQVAVDSFDLPEVQGGRKHVRPFVLNLLSDSIFSLDATKSKSTVTVEALQ